MSQCQSFGGAYTETGQSKKREEKQGILLLLLLLNENYYSGIKSKDC